MIIVLLGGTGYLGSNIYQKLCENGHKVYCVVREKSDLSKLNVSKEKLIYNDLSHIEKLFRSIDVDWIINGICTYKPNDSLYGDMLESNIIFPLSILNLAIKYHVKNYMTIGTGLPDKFNVYSYTKSKFSDFGEFLSEKDNVNFVDLKLEMFYGGVHEPADRFLKSCKNRLKINENIKLTSGVQKRDIIRVEDVVQIISFLVNRKLIKGYKIFPLGSGEQHSIKDIVEFMKKSMGSASYLDFGACKDREAGEPNTIADISWMNNLNIKLTYSFWDGLEEYCLN